MKILVTGSAGFIGFHLVKKLMDTGNEIVGIDNINDYYDPALKFARLAECGIQKDAVEWDQQTVSTAHTNYRFIRMDIVNNSAVAGLFETEKFDVVVHLAAQAGVRYSIINPNAYAQTNLTGFLNILEGCRHSAVKHLVYASSSSVYGLNEKIPFSETDRTDHPVSLYGATKKANELMAHAYSHLYNLPATGLRFFTVYGPWGRPDMAYFLFAEAIMKGKPIQVFNHGKMKRDFTYVDDVINAVVKVMEKPAGFEENWKSEDSHPSSSTIPYKLYNIGNNQPIELIKFIQKIEINLNKKAIFELKAMQAGDVMETWANVDCLANLINYKPNTSISQGIEKFIKWFKQYSVSNEDIL